MMTEQTVENYLEETLITPAVHDERATRQVESMHQIPAESCSSECVCCLLVRREQVSLDFRCRFCYPWTPAVGFLPGNPGSTNLDEQMQQAKCYFKNVIRGFAS